MSTDDSDGNTDLAQELMATIRELREELEALREENRRLREDAEKPDPPSNDEIVDAFFTTKNYADSTQRPYELNIRYFRKHIDDKPLTEATTTDALQFAHNWGTQDDGVAESTMVKYLRRVKRLYDWMGEQDWGPDDNPIERALNQYQSENASHLRRSGQHTGTVIKPHEYSTLTARNNQPRDYALLVLAAKTGLRRKELTQLKLEDIDLDAKKVYNRSPKGVGDDRLPKDSADQKIIDDETVDALDRWIDKRATILDQLDTEDTGWLFINRDGDQTTPMSVSRWWEKATARAAQSVDEEELAANFRSFTPHDARRCFTSWLNWNNCPRDIIAALRGDANADMVALYTQHGEDTVREEYEAAMPSIGI